MADAKVKAEAASRARLSLDKIAPKEKEHIEAPGGSPDTYDPFQAMDDMDLPGPPPQVRQASTLLIYSDEFWCPLVRPQPRAMSGWPSLR